MKKQRVGIYDTTLRDGTQGAGVSFSVTDKLKIARALDAFGVRYIEGGWPGSNPKDELFFREARKLKLKHATVAAFGSTRHKANRPANDPNLCAIVRARVKTACIFGKSWDLHVTQALRASLEENLRMINDSVGFLKSKGMEVIYDAEHFFDGFTRNRSYALQTLRAAIEGGASCLTLCETNGGMLPSDVREITRAVRAEFPDIPLGIHAHNDSDCAVANSIVAVEEGCTLVQGTVNGLGERCGNANLCSIIPALQIKRDYVCVPHSQITRLTQLSRYIDEVVNIVPNDRQPYVGMNAFAHKAGIHVSALARDPSTYEHMDAALVGNRRRILISELSGKSNLIAKSQELSMDLEKDPEAVGRIIASVKDREHHGYQYEDADGSLALLTKKAMGKYKPFFTLKSLRVSVEKNALGNIVSEATIKLDVKGKEEHTVAEGDGPVNALDGCLRKALEKFYPDIRKVKLSDFKVRVINASANTAATVRVLIESSDTESTWGTIGVSENIIEASWQALADAVEYKLMKDGKK